MTKDPDSSKELEAEFVDSVVSHMNVDHLDAVRLYASAYTTYADAKEVRLTGITKQSLFLIIDNNEIQIEFVPELKGPDEVRSRLVQMAREARKILGVESDG